MGEFDSFAEIYKSLSPSRTVPMSIKRFICTGIPPTTSEKLLELKQGLRRDFKGAWLSRESIDMISAIEGYDVWNGFTWEEVSSELPEHEFEKSLKQLRERPM